MLNNLCYFFQEKIITVPEEATPSFQPKMLQGTFALNFKNL